MPETTLVHGAKSRRFLRTARGGLLAALTATLAAATSLFAVSQPAAAALPNVHMASVLVQAQVEPKYGNQPALGGDGSVKLVQSALRAKGYTSVTVDGDYGPVTTAAYRKWQQHLGYSGIDANGLPGVSSLRKLGNGRFTVTDIVSIGIRHDHYRGGSAYVNTRTKNMLTAADALLKNWNFTVIQGGYCYPNCAAASEHTHDGGGVVDVSVAGLSATQRWQEVRALRKVGFAAWLRTPAQGFSYHIHAVAIGDPDLWEGNGSTQVRDQVGDYMKGKNGLAHEGADNTPSQYRVPFTWWEKR